MFIALLGPIIGAIGLGVSALIGGTLSIAAPFIQRAIAQLIGTN